MYIYIYTYMYIYIYKYIYIYIYVYVYVFIYTYICIYITLRPTHPAEWRGSDPDRKRAPPPRAVRRRHPTP